MILVSYVLGHGCEWLWNQHLIHFELYVSIPTNLLPFEQDGSYGYHGIDGIDNGFQCKAVPLLLRMTESGDEVLKEEALEALSLLGYTAPVKGRGIRILALDGGGTR